MVGYGMVWYAEVSLVSLCLSDYNVCHVDSFYTATEGRVIFIPGTVEAKKLETQ